MDSEYLFGWVQTPDFVEALSVLVKGALYPAVTDNQVRDQFLPLPPLSEQKRIAGILREQMGTVEQARRAAEEQIRLSGLLMAAYLRDSLKSGPLVRAMLRDALQEAARGIGDRWHQYRLVGATRSGLAPAKEGVGKNPCRYKLVEPGTIFYNPMRILLGSIAMIDQGDEPGITNPDYVVFKPKAGVIHARWFYHWFRSSAGASFIKKLTRGAVRERLLFRRLAAAEVDIPAWEIQCAFAEKMATVERLQRALEEQLEAINKLPAALLRKAFNGEL